MKNMKINSSVTEHCNTLPPPGRSHREFLSKAKTLCKSRGYFDRDDFREMTDGNYRLVIYRLKPYIEIVCKTNPCQYRLKRTSMEDTKIVTEEPTGDRMISLLLRLKEQPAKIHDIKLKFNHPLHEKLIIEGFSPNKFNSGIKLGSFQIEEFNIQVMVYPETVQIDLGCTNQPLVYDVHGVIRLSVMLGRLYQLLSGHTRTSDPLPYVGSWIVTHYHFGKDGSETYSGQMYCMTIENVTTGLIRFYSKSFPNGRVVPRIEQIQRPNCTFDQEIDKMIDHDMIVNHLIEDQQEYDSVIAEEEG